MEKIQKIQQLEKIVIGTIMGNNKLLKNTMIESNHLISQKHRTILKKMQKLDKEGYAIDAITLVTKTDIHDIESLGGADYLIEMQDMANEELIEKYEYTIRSEYQKRMIKAVCEEVLNNDELTYEEVMAKLNALDYQKNNDRLTAYEMATQMTELPFVENLNEKSIPTGIQSLDTITGGLQKSELYIVAGRPSMGKTAFALNIAINAEKAGVKVIFFSLEMGERDIRNRLASMLGNLNLNKFKNPIKNFSNQDKKDWKMVIEKISKMDFVVYSSPVQPIAEIRSKIRKELVESPEKNVVVLIDYLQLIKPIDSRATSNVQISQISRDLKQLAREFNIPVVCLSQLNRSVETRDNKRPMMSDLRDSGSIEQDADVILLLYRDGYYNCSNKNKDDLEIHVAKNRQGETGVLKTMYDLTRGRISDDNS